MLVRLFQPGPKDKIEEFPRLVKEGVAVAEAGSLSQLVAQAETEGQLIG